MSGQQQYFPRMFGALPRFAFLAFGFNTPIFGDVSSFDGTELIGQEAQPARSRKG